MSSRATGAAARVRPRATDRHDRAWREPAQIVGAWQSAAIAPALLRHHVDGAFWDVLESLRITLLVTREYEHLLMAFQVVQGRPRVTHLAVPHPSGLAVDRARGIVHLASTRNPNQLVELRPVRAAAAGARGDAPVLMPLRARFLPGSTYLHDIALIDGALHANAVHDNAVIRFDDDGGYRRVWWPRCIERGGRPSFERNHLQLNSIAAGPSLERSYFSASTDVISSRRPGHVNFRVGGAGVVFSGRTRDVAVRGLTRPHSARLHGGRLWVCNSGHGEVGVGVGERFAAVTGLPGWTRGLCFSGDVAFAGTSRVLPRFRHYAPGLDSDAAQCGVHAFDARTGTALGRIRFPFGDQIFAIDWLPNRLAGGLPFTARRSARRERMLFFSFSDPLFRSRPR